MKLYLMRHGQASSPDVDPRQGLSPAGKAEIERLASQLAEQGIRFQQVLHSEKDRAMQTARLMAAACAPGIVPELRSGLKPNDDPRLILPDIDKWQHDTLLVSHLPFAPGLLSLLCGNSINVSFSTGTVVCLNKQDSGWQFEWHVSP